MNFSEFRIYFAVLQVSVERICLVNLDIIGAVLKANILVNSLDFLA